MRFRRGLHRVRDRFLYSLTLDREGGDVLAETLLKIIRKFVVGNFADAAIIRDANAVIFLPHNGHIVVNVAIFRGPIFCVNR